MEKEFILCLDIGAETQHALLYAPEREWAGCPAFTLPSPERCAAKRIRDAAAKRRPLYLSGCGMGGAFMDALKEYVRSGLDVTIAPWTAEALYSEHGRLPDMGMTLAGECPKGAECVELGDFDPVFWRNFLGNAGFAMPRRAVVAARAHGGRSAGEGEGRMRMWRDFLCRDHGEPATLLYYNGAVPKNLTRLRMIQERSNGPVADADAAVLLGALSMQELSERSWREGITVLNADDRHTVAFLVYQGRVWGVYEQHTQLLTTELLQRNLEEFRLGWLPDEVVRNAGGHGCALLELPPEAEGFRPTFVFGPRGAAFPGIGKRLQPGDGAASIGICGLLYGIRLRQGA